MFIRREISILLAIFSFIGINMSSINRQMPVMAVERDSCVFSFSEFAYGGPRDRNEEEILPLDPWQFVDAVPPDPAFPLDEIPESELQNYYGLDVVLSRSLDSRSEIWLTGRLSWRFESAQIIIIYQPETGAWEFVSANIEDTPFFLKDLFVDSHGTIWGRAMWETLRGDPPETVPVLATFNETTRHFEFVEGVLETRSQTKILLDNDDIFWIFSVDGLYRYDPANHLTEEKLEFTDGVVSYPSLAPDGSIYFAQWQTPLDTMEDLYTISGVRLFQFFPKTDQILSIPTPEVEWPIFNSMLVDNAGRLWLGSIGYRDLNGNWHLMHSNADEFFAHLGDQSWGTPSIMLESSDGRVWFRKDLDTSDSNQGTAWYDPETGEGCMFTNQQANIIEDDYQRLWMMAGGNLYQYLLLS